MKKCLMIFLMLFVGYLPSVEAFSIDIMDDFFQVRSPQRFSQNIVVAVENKTLSSVRGILLINGKRQIPMAIPSRTIKRTSLRLEDASDVLEFVPYSPASQTLSLVFGQGKYEIPAQNR